jgi:hypothetical protein
MVSTADPYGCNLGFLDRSYPHKKQQPHTHLILSLISYLCLFLSLSYHYFLSCYALCLRPHFHTSSSLCFHLFSLFHCLVLFTYFVLSKLLSLFLLFTFRLFCLLLFISTDYIFPVMKQLRIFLLYGILRFIILSTKFGN